MCKIHTIYTHVLADTKRLQRNIMCLWTKALNYEKDAELHQINLQNQLLLEFQQEFQMQILKCLWKYKKERIIGTKVEE